MTDFAPDEPRPCACCPCNGTRHGEWDRCFIEHRHGCDGRHDKRTPCNGAADHHPGDTVTHERTFALGAPYGFTPSPRPGFIGMDRARPDGTRERLDLFFWSNRKVAAMHGIPRSYIVLVLDGSRYRLPEVKWPGDDQARRPWSEVAAEFHEAFGPLFTLPAAERAAHREKLDADPRYQLWEAGIHAPVAGEGETAEEAEWPRCDMTHTPPFDFAQCEKHDTTFPLGGACKFSGRDPFEVLHEEVDQQRGRAVRAEMRLDLVRGFASVVADVAAERDRQDAQWGQQSHPDGTGPDVQLGMIGWAKPYRDWATSLQEATDDAAKRGEVTWGHILLEEVFEALAEDAPERLRAELVQVAAVAQQWVEAIDLREEAGTPPPTPLR